MQPSINAYILAGGLSSRMGRDKAMLQLGGRTLLSRAVRTLKTAQSLRCDGNEAGVTIVGERTLLEGADRAIADRHPGCGPLGGMEAALNDLREIQKSDWAFFIPVDMPFLTANLIDGLLCEWTRAGNDGARVCFPAVGETPQPLVSLVHRSVHPYLVTALGNARLKVTPVLRSACEEIASAYRGDIGSIRRALWETVVTEDSPALRDANQTMTLTEKGRFANINSPEDLLEAETFLRSAGSNGW